MALRNVKENGGTRLYILRGYPQPDVSERQIYVPKMFAGNYGRGGKGVDEKYCEWLFNNIVTTWKEVGDQHHQKE